jgi:Tfp pilus assembly PilM family ATPase
VVIAHGKNMVFAKHVSVGGDQFNKRVAEAMKCDLSAAKELRIKVAHQKSQANRLPAGVVGIGANGKEGTEHPLGRANTVNGAAGLEAEAIGKAEQAIVEPLETLISELELCVRYYESIFPGKVVDRAIFVGGESRHVALCQAIAQRLGVPATLGDPLARLQKDGVAKTSVDLRQPQPGWAIAVGLGIGLSPAPTE